MLLFRHRIQPLFQSFRSLSDLLKTSDPIVAIDFPEVLCVPNKRVVTIARDTPR